MIGEENYMEVIRNSEFGGERPLFESHNLRLENVIIRAGESAIKECSNIEAVDCRFEGNYPFWHVHGFKIERCYFDVGGRSAPNSEFRITSILFSFPVISVTFQLTDTKIEKG